MLPKLESYSVRIFGVGNLHFVGRGAGEALQAIAMKDKFGNHGLQLIPY